ncbi:MAG: ESX secretion-associated protein EspG [Actinophytocola sp.]|uniref:ESX secretion-associated protein EspG n=1 Tax=Actinophytocola sp. TaxID=1872138 RepID=UPI003C744AEC
MRFNGREVSVAAFDVLWQAAVGGIGKPSVLQCGSPGATDAERARVEARAAVELRAAGYAGPRGPGEDVLAGLALLAQPPLAVDVRLFERASAVPGALPAPTKRGTRLAVGGSTGVAAVLGPSGFRAWSFPKSSLVNEVIALFGHHEPPNRIPGGVAIDVDQLYAPARKGNVEALLRQLEKPFLRRAHVCALVRDRIVGRTDVLADLTLNDIDTGRYLVFTDRNQIVITPGNRVTLERKLKDVIGSRRQY